MPWLSKRQQAWGNSPSGLKALGGKSKVDEWNHATDYSSLPEPPEKKKSAKGALGITKVKRNG